MKMSVLLGAKLLNAMVYVGAARCVSGRHRTLVNPTATIGTPNHSLRATRARRILRLSLSMRASGGDHCSKVRVATVRASAAPPQPPLPRLETAVRGVP